MIGRRNRSFDIAHLLRALVGAREEILDATPSERLRYTSLAVVVLSTAGFAMLSMAYALHLVFDGFRPWTIPIALLWGLFIFNLDRWLASAAPTPGIRALPRVLSRLALAVLLGVILAEPLMLGIFQSAVEEQVAQSRQQVAIAFESQLRACNQLTPSASPPDSCADKRLSSYDPVLIRTEQLDRLRQEAEALQTQITQISRVATELQQAAVRECSGTSGVGSTGRPGEGPVCQQRQAEASRYPKDSGLAGKQDRLRDLNASISVVERDSDAYLLSAANGIEAEIEAEVRQFRASQQQVGLLERLAALSALTRENSYLAVAEWTLRLTLILIEIMPVLLRILMGSTNHDRLVRISERQRIDDWVTTNARTTHGLFDVLEAQQRELVAEIPVERRETVR